jgi:hypothetical protein
MPLSLVDEVELFAAELSRAQEPGSRVWTLRVRTWAEQRSKGERSELLRSLLRQLTPSVPPPPRTFSESALTMLAEAARTWSGERRG